MGDYINYLQEASGRVEKVKVGFSWPAFLFGPIWWLYKGLFGRAILTMIGVIFAGLIFNETGALIFWLIIGIKANRVYEDYLISKGYTRTYKKEYIYRCQYCQKAFNKKAEAKIHLKSCQYKRKGTYTKIVKSLFD